ncbi:hypothetical protein AB4427_17815 [Vibrio artabrorum]|uniref:hypothetical protein n=1 Tax=Vibrio artabrorum TaxID=446374 RepID=UPI0035543D9F
MKTLFLVRGPFGVQKTDMAKSFCNTVVSCWDYYEKYGENKFNVNLKVYADKYCIDKTIQLMNDGIDKIAVANSFSQINDLDVYKKEAHKHGYQVFVMISDNDVTNESRRNAPQEVILQQIVKLKNDTNYETAVNHFLL